MSRVQPVTADKAKPAVQEIYKALEKKMGKVPNIFLNMGNSAAVLKGYLGLSDAVNLTSLDPKLREEIALIVGQANQCNYCLSAHTAIAKGTGLSDQEILSARNAQSQNPKTQAILTFVKSVVDKRGKIDDQEVTGLKAKGVNDAEIAEIIMIITLNMFTNYFNLVTDTKIDFPIAPKLT